MLSRCCGAYRWRWERGKIVALLGANGAGKTTTLKAISGMLKTEEGEVTDGSIDFVGKRIDHYGPGAIATLGISQAMEGRRVLEHLSVEENLFVGAYCRKDRAGIKEDLEMVFELFPQDQAASPPDQRLFVRRRTTDAGDRAGPHGPSETDAVG